VAWIKRRAEQENGEQNGGACSQNHRNIFRITAEAVLIEQCKGGGETRGHKIGDER
jgi:hypothetical protein